MQFRKKNGLRIWFKRPNSQKTFATILLAFLLLLNHQVNTRSEAFNKHRLSLMLQSIVVDIFLNINSNVFMSYYQCLDIFNHFNNLGLILQSTDRRMLSFLDILIECELKQVISNSAVQQYAGKIFFLA